MSSKKDKDNVKEEVVEEMTESQEITATFNDLKDADSSSNKQDQVKMLLGKNKLSKVKEKKILLLLENIFSRESLIAHVSVGETPKSKEGFCVLGPFGVTELKKLAFDGDLRKTDRLLFAGSRWKPVLEEFPEWAAHLQRKDEYSRTMELTQTDTLESGDREYVERKIEDNNNESNLELEDFGDELLRKTTDPVKAQTERQKPTRLVINKKLEIENVEEKPLRPIDRLKSRKIEETKKSSTLTWAVLGIGIVVGIYILKMKDSTGLKDPTLEPKAGIQNSNEVKSSSDWPVNLQPRSLASLYQDDSTIMKKIRPLMRAYETGVTSFSPSDEMLLRRLSDPASSSWEARKIAANQLAVHYLSRGDIQRARTILEPILQESSDDFATLVNTALIEISDSKMAQARDALRVAFRIERDMQWLTLSLLGMLEGLSDRWAEADKNFQEALVRNPNNPFITGLWLQTLLKQGKGVRFQIQKLVQEALWADPDTFLDAPIPAPIAGHFFYSEAMDGLIRGAESLGNVLSPAKLSYLRWLKGRMISFSPLSQSAAQMTKELELDEDIQSQVLLAYMLKESQQFDQASAVLTRSLPLIDDQKLTKSSWPWTLAGDVALARSRYDQAITFFQSGLNRNNNDHAAVHGLAITLRDRGQFQDAQQKLRETLSLQPHFLPAQLRMTRFEWQRMARRQ